MSKVGESVIRGAIEALDFAQGKFNASVVHIPSVIALPGTSESDSNIIERAEEGKNFFAIRKLDFKE